MQVQKIGAADSKFIMLLSRYKIDGGQSQGLMPTSYKAVRQLEAENVELRRRLAELALEIEALREG